MKTIWKLDSENFYIFGSDRQLEDDAPIPSGYTDIRPEMNGIGFYKPKLVGSTVVEGIEEIPTSHEPRQISNEELSNEMQLLKKQNVDLAFELMMKGVL